MLGMWLPAALASLVQAVYSAHRVRPPAERDIYADWGLEALARQCDEARDALTDRTIESLGG